MSTYRTSRSPTRRYGDPRASTGTVFASSFDTRPQRYDRLYAAQPIARRTYIDDGHGGNRTSRTEYAVRPRHNSFLEEENRRPSNTHLAPPMSPPRIRPVVMNTGHEGPRSAVYSPQQHRDAADRYLVPAASGANRHHHRHHSATPEDMDRIVTATRDGRERAPYYRSGGSSMKSYPASRPPVRYSEEDGYSYTGPREQFARDFPSPPPQSASIRHDGQGRRDRPASVIDIPVHDNTPANRKDHGPPSASTRQFERLDRLDPNRLSVRPAGDSDPDRGPDIPRRHHSVRNAVVHQPHDEQYPVHRDDHDDRRSSRQARNYVDDDRDYGKSSKDMGRDQDRDRDYPYRAADYRRRPRSRETSPDHPTRDRPSTLRVDEPRRPQRSRESSPERPHRGSVSRAGPEPKRPPRSRDPSPDRSGLAKGLAAVGLGGAAAAGLANGLGKEHRDPEDVSDVEGHKERRRRRNRDRDRDLETEGALGSHASEGRRRDPTRQDESEALDPRRDHPGDRMSSDSQDEAHRSRRHHRRRHHRDRDQGPSDSPSESGSDRQARGSRKDVRGGRADREPGEPEQFPGRARDASPTREISGPNGENRTVPPGDDEDGRPRRVQLVEPVKEEKPENKPKGILKPARKVPFPEDPNPVREGVAPLNSAGRDGIPPQARWTKISRMLVNPEALRKANERFEERDDYVIVLRVLPKEEIGKLAEKTVEIRGKYSVGFFSSFLSLTHIHVDPIAEAREREWEEELAEKERRRRRQQEHHDTSEGAGEGENKAPPLAIESAPPPLEVPQAATAAAAAAAVPLDPRVFQKAQDPLGRSSPNQLVTPTVNIVPETYSEKV